MAFACLDDGWDEHPKYAELELEHFGLMACAIVYCNRRLTDGRVPDKAVRGFGKSGKGPKLAAKLVAENIWRRIDGGFEVVGYLEHNPSRAAVLARRAQRAASGKLGGFAKAKTSASAVADALALATAPARAVANTNVLPSPLLSSPTKDLTAAAAQDLPRAREGAAGKQPAASRHGRRSRLLPAEQQHFSKNPEEKSGESLGGFSPGEIQAAKRAESAARERMQIAQGNSGLPRKSPTGAREPSSPAPLASFPPYDHMAVGPLDEHGNGPFVHRDPKPQKRSGGAR